MGISYATREQVKAAAGSTTTRDDASIDRALLAHSLGIEGLCGGRTFYPEIATKKFAWPCREGAAVERLWFDGPDLYSLTSVTVDNGATSLSLAGVFPEPQALGPPYDRIEVDLSSSAFFSAGGTFQRAVAVTGVWGHIDGTSREDDAGTITTSPNASATSIAVSNAALVGVLDLLKIGTERLIVTSRSWLTTGQTISGTLAAQQNATSFTVADGTAVHAGEMLYADAEQMIIDAVTGNTVIVRRAQNGTVLAAHTNSTLYAPRTLTVVRGVLGTTAAAHTAADAVTAFRANALVVQWVIAQCVATLNQQSAGYAATAGSGDNQREVTGRALAALTAQVQNAYAKCGRTRAV